MPRPTPGGRRATSAASSAEVMAHAEAEGSVRRLASWADWARAEADALDPLLNDTLVPPKS